METDICQPDPVQKEKSCQLLQIDPYCYAISITCAHEMRSVTVGPITCEIFRFAHYFLHERSTISGTSVDTTPRICPIPERGLEIELVLQFTHPVKHILKKGEELAEKQLCRMKDRLKPSPANNKVEESEKEDYIVESDIEEKDADKQSAMEHVK